MTQEEYYWFIRRPQVLRAFKHMAAGGDAGSNVPQEDPDPVDMTRWGQLVAALEDCKPSDFNMANLSYIGSNPTLAALAVGSEATVKYAINDTDLTDKVDTTWINLGFNATIPEYVKYRRAVGSGYKHVWIKTMKSELISPIAVGDAVYTRTYDAAIYDNTYTSVDGEVITAKDGTFIYGNNCTYNVPTSITTAKGTYTFCGYNLMLNSQALLACNVGDSLIRVNAQYQSDSKNRYAASTIRTWMNTTSLTPCCNWKDYDWSDDGVAAIGLLPRLTNADGFLQNAMKTVNRTWVYEDWRSGVTLDANNCEHVVDKMFLLSGGHVENGGDDYLDAQDKAYDTSKILSFNSNESRIKYDMAADGTSSAAADVWWLRSAGSDNYNIVGYIYNDGSVDSNAVDSRYSYCGLASACTIG